MDEDVTARRRTAKEILDLVKARLPGEYWEDYPDGLIREQDGFGVTVQLGPTLFYFDHRTGSPELVARRFNADGAKEAGSVLEDGTVTWGRILAGSVSLN